MNTIKHRTITIEFDSWEPMEKALDKDIDDLLYKIREKVVLRHAGNVKTLMLTTTKQEN